MQHWKFLLLGISGDLAKRKILPALSQFSELNKDKVTVDLIGYSRSLANELEILAILDANNSNGKHNLNSLKLVQGEYSNPTYFINLVNSLAKNERIVLYLATPPVVFLDILQTFCPYSQVPLDIIIEKPFGRDLTEAKGILAKVRECKLENNVHFCDHYLFKSATRLTLETKRKLDFLKSKKIHSVTARALEDLDVKGRGGYYNEAGAIKDFMPAHLFSLMKSGLSLSGRDKAEEYDNLEAKSLELGQYSSYLQDIEIPESSTDTYFKATFKNSFQVIMESGKKLGVKETSIEVVYEDGTKLIWNIYPKLQIAYKDINDPITIDLNDSNKLDHTNMFEDLLKYNHSYFVNNGDTLKGWNLYNKVIDFKEKEGIKTRIYKDDIWPVVYTK